MKIIPILSLLFCLSALTVYSQDLNYKVIEIAGKLINEETGEPIQFAHIVNIKKRQATISDTSGIFRMVMLSTDSLRISSIGYNIKYFSPHLSENLEKVEVVIKMTKKVYDLAVVNVFEERWKAFVYDFSRTKIEQDENKDRLEKWIETVIDVDELKLVTRAAQGVGFPINYKTSKEKRRELVKQLLKKDEEDRKAKEKFNNEFVKAITGITDSTELQEFVLFCRYDSEFIVKTTEYELIIITQQIFEHYKKEKPKKQK